MGRTANDEETVGDLWGRGLGFEVFEQPPAAVKGLGCRVWGLGFKVQGLGLRVTGLGLRA